MTPPPQSPLPSPAQAPTRLPTPMPRPTPAPSRQDDFPERHDDPDQAEELERQQDA
ncbi:MAG: hypothetical protein ACKOXU_08310 [Limnohabitans sp.]